MKSLLIVLGLFLTSTFTFANTSVALDLATDYSIEYCDKHGAPAEDVAEKKDAKAKCSADCKKECCKKKSCDKKTEEEKAACAKEKGKKQCCAKSKEGKCCSKGKSTESKQ